MLLLTIVLALAVLATSDNYRSYAGYTVYQVTPSTAQQLEHLQKFVLDKVGYDVWKEGGGVGQGFHVNVPPQLRHEFFTYLHQVSLTAQVLIEDVGALVTAERSNILARRANINTSGHPVTLAFDYNVYHPLEEINTWITEIAANYSSMVTVLEVGSSYENRIIRALKISTGTGRRGFWIDGGTHAREWISPATILYTTKTLLERYGIDDDVTTLLNTFDWYILPVLNVDGYVYSWTSDRLWRKTRSPNEGSPCDGTDPNRNWNVHWGPPGCSTAPCSDAYCGTSAFSEIEVASVASYVAGLPLDAFISYHNYGQMYMTPFGYTDTLPADWTMLKAAGDDAVAAITALPNGAAYRCNNLYALVGQSSGSSVDYTYENLGITWSFGVELRDLGQFGFELPETEIQPTAEESFHALHAIAQHVMASKH